MAERYLNREIDAKFDFIRDALIRIEAQTTRTNGRVTKTEEEIIEIKAGIAIGKWILGGIGTLSLALLTFILKIYVL